MHKIIPRYHYKRSQLRRNLWPESDPNIHVIGVPILSDQPLAGCLDEVIVVIRDLMIVLSCHTYPHRRIPGGADRVFLAEELRILIDLVSFVALNFTDMAVFEVP